MANALTNSIDCPRALGRCSGTARLIGAAIIASALSADLLAAAGGGDVDWRVYGGNAAGQRYSRLGEIDRSNVGRLAEAWRFETGEGGLQTSPIVVGHILYGYMPDQKVFALDAATGALLWRFDEGSGSRQPARGMSYWEEGPDKRLFVSGRHHLWALDPATGRPITGFGDGGKLDLRVDLGDGLASNAVFLTTPGAIYQDLIITGFRTSESPPGAPGAVRAYDVRTGRLRWSFRLIPAAGEPGAATWPADASRSAGAANSWAGMVVDEKRGIVFVPTGSAVYDFYGGDRAGDNLYANSLVALDAGTGKRLWHFQAVHHDILDRDLPSPPVLLTVRHDGRPVDAVAQVTKQGLLFLFDRVTGKPLFPIEERPVPQSDVPGEHAAATQPFPLKPAPFTRQRLTEQDLTTRTPQAHTDALQRFRAMRNEGPYTPLAMGRQTLVVPGFDGGANWGGQAVDPRGIFYVNAQDGASYSSMSLNRSRGGPPGERLYQQHCSACHGIDRQGIPPQFPSLTGLAARMDRARIEMLVELGSNRMPGFPQIGAADRKILIDHLLAAPRPGIADPDMRAMAGNMASLEYQFSGYNKFRDPDGYPALQPPWGTLTAIDLNTGEHLWRVPLGEYPELTAAGIPPTGTDNYGGPLVTAGGVLFIGATVFDRKFRAFDTRNGKLLWQTQLPYAGVATPITYRVDGRQYVLIAASGARDPKGPKGSAYIAFALPPAR
jgi:quinoprotein glucose dehydrogenase